ncbi:hypothetical protein HDZ31DRAFT_66858 [Schizophyllum fasciatum]
MSPITDRVADPHRFRIGTIAQHLTQRADSILERATGLLARNPLIDEPSPIVKGPSRLLEHPSSLLQRTPSLLQRTGSRLLARGAPLLPRGGDASQETSEPSNSKSDSNTGTIIGAVVVGVALLLVVGGFLLAWRQRTSKRKAEYMAADTGDAFDDGDHYDMDVQRAADDGVRGFRMYGQRGRGYGEGGAGYGHDGSGYDDPYDPPTGYDAHGYDADAPPRYEAKRDARGRPVSGAESGRTLYEDGAGLQKTQSDDTIHVPARPVDKEDGLR